MPRSSPPKHRHDGTSPLPMGMDWSPPPKRWEGGNTVWPHDPRTGWSYCVMIPSWVVQPESGASTDSLLNPIIFYRVLVGIQSPEGVSTSRGILRRFSDFLKLFSAIRKALPRKSIPAAPSKHALVRINSSRLLLEERRRSLEEWMGKLLSDIDVSRSAPVAAFLELEAAVRSSFQDVDTQSLEQSSSNGAIAMPSSIAYRVSSGVSVADSPAAATKYQSVASDFGSDCACETPDLGTPRQDRHHISENGGKDWVSSHGSTGNVGALANGVLLGESCSEQPDDLIGRKLHHHKEKLVLENDHVYAKCSKEVTLSTDGQEFMSEQSYDKLWGHARKHSEESIGSDVSSIRGSELMNSGVNNLVGDGSTDLHGGDAQSAIKTHSSETQYLNDEQLIVPLDQRHKLNRILLTMQRRLVMAKNDMDNLIARLNQEVAVKEYLATKVKDLEGELEATKQKGKENLQQAILIEKERITQMQWDMDELRRKYMENESRLKFEQDEKTRVESEKTTASGEKDLLLQELGTKQGQLETLQKRLVDLEGKSRSDVKVLAKEIKMLRSSQTELKEALNQAMKEKTKLEKFIQKDNQRWANVKAARKKLLHECEVLRHQLQECSVNFLADEKDKFNVSSTSLSDSLDLLATSDDRINLLLAEVQLLPQNDEHATDVDRTGCSNSTDTPPIDGEGLAGTDDDEIRNILTDLLVDNATLRKQINSVVQCSLQTIFKPTSEETDESPSSKTVLNTFLER